MLQLCSSLQTAQLRTAQPACSVLVTSALLPPRSTTGPVNLVKQNWLKAPSSQNGVVAAVVHAGHTRVMSVEMVHKQSGCLQVPSLNSC